MHRDVAEAADALDATVRDLGDGLAVRQRHGEEEGPREDLDGATRESLPRQAVEPHVDVRVVHLVDGAVSQEQYVAQQAGAVGAGQDPAVSDLGHPHHPMHGRPLASSPNDEFFGVGRTRGNAYVILSEFPIIRAFRREGIKNTYALRVGSTNVNGGSTNQ